MTGPVGGSPLTFSTTCHGAGRKQSRTSAKLTEKSNIAKEEGEDVRHYKERLSLISSEKVLNELSQKGITVRVANPLEIAEEGPDAYKDVEQVVQICKPFLL